MYPSCECQCILGKIPGRPTVHTFCGSRNSAISSGALVGRRRLQVGHHRDIYPRNIIFLSFSPHATTFLQNYSKRRCFITIVIVAILPVNLYRSNHLNEPHGRYPEYSTSRLIHATFTAWLWHCVISNLARFGGLTKSLSKLAIPRPVALTYSYAFLSNLILFNTTWAHIRDA